MEGRILLFAGRIDPAIEQLQQTLKIEPSFSLAEYDLGKAHLQKGMINEEIGELQESANLRFRISERDAAVAYASAKAGKTGEARSVLRRYLEQSKRSYVSWYGIAFIYSGLGDKDQALACLEKAFQQHSVRLRDLKVEPFLQSLHPDPRFSQLLRRLGLET